VIVRCAGAPYTYGALAHRPEDLPLLAWIV